MKKKVIVLLVVLLVMGLLGTGFGQSAKESMKLYKQGQEAYQYGRYEEALRYFEGSLKINRSLNDAQGIAANLNEIGLVYDSLGQYEKALSYYEHALKICKELDIPQYIAASLNNIGAVYDSLGQYEKALSYYEESLKIKREHNLSPQSIATSLNNIGAVYDSLGQYEKALSYYEEALKIDRKLEIPQDIATNLNNIGAVYDSLGQYEKALSYYEESLKIKREHNLSPESIATSLKNIGAVYLSMKRYKEAEERFLEAEREYEKTGYKWGETSLVELYLATKRTKKALSLLKEMTPKWNSDDPYRIYFHTQHGLALAQARRLKEASEEFLKAILISEEMRERVKERKGFFEGGYAGGRIRSYRGLVASLSERVIKGEAKDESFNPYGKDLVSAAFYFSELTKARVLLEAMAESARRYTKSEIPPDVRKKEEDIFNQLSAIENQWEEMYKKGEDAFKGWVERKEGLKKELNALISKLRREYPRYVALNYPKPIPVEELPLKEDEVLLGYAICDDAGYLFVVSKGEVKKVLRIPKSKEDLEALVNEFILPLQSPHEIKREGFSLTLGQRLYNLLLAEALKDISQKTNIIIVPDGILGLLPFEALVIEMGRDYKDSLYVGDKWRISYYQSAAILALNRLLKPSTASKPLFALGNPIFNKDDPRYIAYKENKPQPTLLAYNKSRYSYHALATRREWGKTTEDDKEGDELRYEPLLETEDEVRAIAGLFAIKPAPPDVLLGMEANETNLYKSPLKDYRYLHFATHADLPGKVQGINEPFLLLGQVENKEEDDGFLTLTEVLELKLDADMVVLSACLTGRGKVMEGEGVVNFARAFHHAGARSVVVSLWEVASQETVEYMKLFYQYLKEGKSRDEALRLAREKIKAKYPNPFYWAPFILHGER